MQVAKALNSIYKGGKILVITGSAQQNIIMHASGIHLANFQKATEGYDINYKPEPSSLTSDYIIASKKPGSDSITYAENLIKNQHELSRDFDKAYENSHYLLFIRNGLAE